MAILPRKQVHMFCGASGSGKTTLVLQMIHANETGGSFPVALDGVAHVNYVVADRTAEETQKRADQLDIKNIEIYGISDDTKLPLSMLDRPELLLRQTLTKFKKMGDLIVIDPIMLFMEGEGKSYASVARSLIRLSRVAIENNITLLAIHHTVKTRTDFTFARPQDRISGSAAFQGYSGTQMVLIEGSETQRDYDDLVVVSHMSPKEQFRLQRDDAGWFTLQYNNGVDQLKAMLSALTGLLVPKQDLHNKAAFLGLQPDEVQDALKDLVADGPKGFYRKLS